MNDRLDDRIRELYTELTDAAPELPPLPARGATAAPPWRRRLVVASAAAAGVVVIVGVGAALLTQVEFGGAADDAAAPAATAAPPPPAATIAPTSPPETIVEAPGAAAEDPGDQGRPRPVERILLLADLNRSCTEATQLFELEIPRQLEAEEDFRSAFGLMFERLEELRVIVEEANSDLSDSELLDVGDVIFGAQGTVIVSGDEPVAPRYPDVVTAVKGLGGFLADFGATDCVSLASSLP